MSKPRDNYNSSLHLMWYSAQVLISTQVVSHNSTYILVQFAVKWKNDLKIKKNLVTHAFYYFANYAYMVVFQKYVGTKN